MEDKTPKAESAAKGQESLSYQRRMWKNFQVKTKPWLSPKLGSERRSGAEASKKESGLWMFKRKKKQLDRVFSSSQPNLCCSNPASFDGDKSLGSDSVPGTSTGHPLQQLGAAAGPTGSKPELMGHGSPKLAVSQLAMSHQKSSSLGSACFEKLVVDSVVMGEEEQLRKNARVISLSPGKMLYRDVSCDVSCMCSATGNLECACQIRQKTNNFSFTSANDHTKVPTHSTPEEEQWNSPEAVGKWCTLLYDGRIYPGIIQETHCQVKCMHRVGENRFFWPLRDDLHWYPFEDMLTIIPPPVKVNSRHVAIAREIWNTLSAMKFKSENEKNDVQVMDRWQKLAKC